jgi:hypothetical protein
MSNEEAASVLAAVPGSRMDVARLGGLMTRSRESTPLWVWLTFGLMSVGAALYLAGYLMIDDFLH